MINGKTTIVAIGNENMEFGTPNNLLSTRDASKSMLYTIAEVSSYVLKYHISSNWRTREYIGKEEFYLRGLLYGILYTNHELSMFIIIIMIVIIVVIIIIITIIIIVIVIVLSLSL